MQRMIRILLALAGAVSVLTACSKTVEWEEEVLLNTGETIWIKRSAKYTYQGGTGNPFDLAYRIEGAPTLDFKYGDRNYSFAGRGGLMVIAISPQKIPVLVMSASSGRWDAINKYKCTVPFYVQFVPDETGATWSWPASIEPWLYGLPTNLFGDYGLPGKMLAKYSREEKERRQHRDSRLASFHRIDPNYTGDRCKQKAR